MAQQSGVNIENDAGDDLRYRARDCPGESYSRGYSEKKRNKLRGFETQSGDVKRFAFDVSLLMAISPSLMSTTASSAATDTSPAPGQGEREARGCQVTGDITAALS